VAGYKRSLGIDVLAAARERISWAFDTFPCVCCSFSGGKDSSVMLHLVADEARRRGRRFGLLFIDLEAQFKLTIDHVSECFSDYADCADPFWVALPLHLRNAVSAFEPHWVCWEPDAEWVRQPPSLAITDQERFPFYREAMEFEEFVEDFGHWYGDGKLTACFVGIRTQESLNRWRSLAGRGKSCFDGRKWTTWKGKGVYNIYPIYDWQTEDLWTYFGKFGKRYNRLYDYMHRAGLTLHQMRICQPYGDDQRKGLWLYHLIEPETWGRVVARVSGANQGALYAEERGNILGVGTITKPAGHTWQSYSRLLLETMPPRTREHFENKIAVFLHWYASRGFPDGIPDDGPLTDKSKPSWARICKALLRNDYWCKGLSFTQHKSTAYDKYSKIMRKRKKQWGFV
jgi:predicted phosphoadenosine phosphosulfate sulfurtransferase